MRRFLIATALVVATLAAPGVARADSGTFTTDDGQSCTWFGSGSMYTVSCSGYSFAARGYISCDYDLMGSSVSWRCRDMNGNRWTGSR